MAEICPNDTTNESQGKEALKPCRYCKSRDTGFIHARLVIRWLERCQVYCRTCGASGPNFLGKNFIEAEDGAIRYWNLPNGGMS